MSISHLSAKAQQILNQIKGVIFDLDGTLVDSILNFKQIRADIGCPEGTDTLKFIETLSEDQQAKAKAVVLKHEMQDAEQSRWLPGGQQLVANLNAKNIPLAIVTRNSVEATAMKIRNNAIAIKTVITREQFPPKPAPDALLYIAEQWQLRPSALMYVGDFRYDVEAGNNAGMTSCLITRSRDNDYGHQADLVFDQLNDLNHYYS